MRQVGGSFKIGLTHIFEGKILMHVLTEVGNYTIIIAAR